MICRRWIWISAFLFLMWFITLMLPYLRKLKGKREGLNSLKNLKLKWLKKWKTKKRKQKQLKLF